MNCKNFRRAVSKLARQNRVSYSRPAIMNMTAL
jgi:hypothetical protein